MEDTNKVYRIRTKVGNDAPNVIHVPLNQTYDMFEILSLKLNQTNAYKTYESSYGCIVGRVYANGGVGVANAKVSIFIGVEDNETLQNRLLYNFTSVSSTDNDGVRYNLLPDYVDDNCHQNVGTFPNKRLVLDNQDILEIFDKYWKYTTTTNHAGDYMIFGVPVGSQKLHVDVDLSDCGVLSQRPRDMIAKGYNAEMFESPNKFKSSTNLNSLAQIVSQDKGIYVYPYWGDVTDGDDRFSITRCDISLEYKFESYAVFMGSIITDKGSNAIGKNCAGTTNNGKMSDLIAGEGTIEMIRKTLDGKVEEYPIMGNRLIDSDGVWCYTIPMNLDIVTTDEFGNLVPTDDPNKGIATRARVRFRISLDENPNDATARKRAKYLVPNNPRMGDKEFEDNKMEPDYEFGSATWEESFRDMFWNKVYTVKNYIPKLQKNSKETNRKHTGIKLINHHDDNNPMPYNALTIKLSFTYRLICVITKIVIQLVEFLNETISIIGAILCLILRILDLPILVVKPIFGWIKVFGIGKGIIRIFSKVWNTITQPIKLLIEKIMPNCIGLASDFCDDGINQVTYYPGCDYFYFRLFSLKSIGLDCVWEQTYNNHEKNELKICENEHKTAEECELALTQATNATAMLYNCVENELAQANDATSFNFNNDWINGTLYAPLWYRKLTPKKSFFFGLLKRKAKDQWCSADREFGGLRIIQQCVTRRDKKESYKNFDGKNIDVRYIDSATCGGKCQKSYSEINKMKGVIQTKETMLGQTVCYYSPVQYDYDLPDNKTLTGSNNSGEVKLLFATDIVLLGSLNECDLNGVPQFFKTLESSTYNLPSDILFTDYDFILTINPETGDTERLQETQVDLVTTSEMAGCDWGNPNEFGKYDGGLFYSIGCSKIEMWTKSCINLSRICEYGVSLDETKEVPDLAELGNTKSDIEGDGKYDKLVTDGFVSYDELYNLDERSMFATMNGNRLATILNSKNGLREYDFRYLYPENFDGSLKKIMSDTTKKYPSEINYRNNWQLENVSKDYYLFRMGNCPYYYDRSYSFPRYENSFYFYFGLKAGKTAIEKFNSKYFSECSNNNSVQSQIGIRTRENTWCSEINGNNDGYAAFDFENINVPYELTINGVSDGTYSLKVNDIFDDKIYMSNDNLECVESDWCKDYVRLKDENGNYIGMMPNGSYNGEVIDNDGNILNFTFKLANTYSTYDVNTQSFVQPNNVLLEEFNDSYKEIASDNSGLNTSNIQNITRDIGGVITIYNIRYNDENIDQYKIEIRPKEESGLDYDGIVVIYSNGRLLNTPSELLYWNSENESYAFGLPQGGYTYTITVTQLCDGIDSNNYMSKDVMLNKPTPYKMFINDIDYDLIRDFDDNTGWKITLGINNSSYSEQTINMSNKWFYVDRVFSETADGLYNVDGFYYDENNYKPNNPIVYYTDKNGESHSYDFAVDNWKLWDEFTKEKVSENVYYRWSGQYVINQYLSKDEALDEDNIAEFITQINNILSLREQLAEDMKTTFYINCRNESKNLYIRIQTDDYPGTVTMIYHPETAQEFGEVNILKTDSVNDEDISSLDDIMIPTISYKSSEEFGEGIVGDDAPCIAKSNNHKKKPYSVGIMNMRGISIPKDKNNKSFKYVETNGIKYINHSTANASDMFNFPLIDNILKTDYVAWSSFNNLPKFRPKDNIPAIVNMNGLLAGYTFNGNVTNGRFEIQTLNDIDIKLTENIADKNKTYVTKRIFIGYDDDSVGEWALQILRGVTDKISANDNIPSYFNKIFNTNIFTKNNLYDIINNLEYSNGNLIYGDIIRISINDILTYVFNFTHYIVQYNYINNENNRVTVNSEQQYCFVLPINTILALEGSNYCGVQNTIDGSLQVNLTENAVNNCKTGEKILEVESDNNAYYSIFSANNYYYPINLADKNNCMVWQINSVIDNVFSKNNEQNLFSYHTKSKYLRGENNLVDSNFRSQTLISDDIEEEYKETIGYGTTGLFTPVGEFNYPVFIVSENDSNVRALSPVYDYSYVEAIVKFGIVETSKAISEEDENGNNIYTIESYKSYKLGVSIKKGEQYYLNNYEYRLSGKCRIDEFTTFEISEETLSAPEQYIYETITEEMYKSFKNKYGSAKGPFATTYLKEFNIISTITAYDFTNLKHICAVNTLPKETTWYSFIWYANVPYGIEGVGIRNDNDPITYLEEYYEKDDSLTNKIPIEIIGNDKCEFIGWTENKPLANGETYVPVVFPTKATEPKTYFGNWRLL